MLHIVVYTISYILQFSLKSKCLPQFRLFKLWPSILFSLFWLAKVRLERRTIWPLLHKFRLKQSTSNKAVIPLLKNQISFDRDKNMPLIYFITSSMSLLTPVTSISLTARNAVSSQKRLMRGLNYLQFTRSSCRWVQSKRLACCSEREVFIG